MHILSFYEIGTDSSGFTLSICGGGEKERKRMKLRNQIEIIIFLI